MFQVDYGDHDHVFTDLQKWYRQKVDFVLLGNVNSKTTKVDSTDSNDRLKAAAVNVAQNSDTKADR